MFVRLASRQLKCLGLRRVPHPTPTTLSSAIPLTTSSASRVLPSFGKSSLSNPWSCYQLKINVGRGGTNQLCLLERYLDVLVKHTTEIPSPTALVEGTAPICLSRRRIVKMSYFKLWVLDFTKPNHAHTCYQLHVGNESPMIENLLEMLWNPSPISRFPSPKIQFSLYEIQFSPIGFLLSSMAFRFLQWLSTFFNGFLLSSTASRFLQRLSDFPQRLSDFPQRLSSFRVIQENLFTTASIQKITIQALYFPPLVPRAS